MWERKTLENEAVGERLRTSAINYGMCLADGFSAAVKPASAGAKVTGHKSRVVALG
jgi:hypothetical protein